MACNRFSASSVGLSDHCAGLIGLWAIHGAVGKVGGSLVEVIAQIWTPLESANASCATIKLYFCRRRSAAYVPLCDACIRLASEYRPRSPCYLACWPTSIELLWSARVQARAGRSVFVHATNISAARQSSVRPTFITLLLRSPYAQNLRMTCDSR